ASRNLCCLISSLYIFYALFIVTCFSDYYFFFFHFFFLMIRRPPRSTLFPTRRSSDLHGLCPCIRLQTHSGFWRPWAAQNPEWVRSEEHTSELQSLAYLVCRLLLEKKKKKASSEHLLQTTTAHNT